MIELLNILICHAIWLSVFILIIVKWGQAERHQQRILFLENMWEYDAWLTPQDQKEFLDHGYDRRFKNKPLPFHTREEIKKMKKDTCN